MTTSKKGGSVGQPEISTVGAERPRRCSGRALGHHRPRVPAGAMTRPRETETAAARGRMPRARGRWGDGMGRGLSGLEWGQGESISLPDRSLVPLAELLASPVARLAGVDIHPAILRCVGRVGVLDAAGLNTG